MTVPTTSAVVLGHPQLGLAVPCRSVAKPVRVVALCAQEVPVRRDGHPADDLMVLDDGPPEQHGG